MSLYSHGCLFLTSTDIVFALALKSYSSFSFTPTACFCLHLRCSFIFIQLQSWQVRYFPDQFQSVRRSIIAYRPIIRSIIHCPLRLSPTLLIWHGWFVTFKFHNKKKHCDPSNSILFINDGKIARHIFIRYDAYCCNKIIFFVSPLLLFRIINFFLSFVLIPFSWH